MIINSYAPRKNEYLDGWLFMQSAINGCSSAHSYLSDIHNADASDLSAFRKPAGMHLMLQYISDEFGMDIFSLFFDSEPYDFYKHFFGRYRLQSMLNTAFCKHSDFSCGFPADDELKLCPRCDGYFRTDSQIPFTDTCPACGRRLVRICINGYGKTTAVRPAEYYGIDSFIRGFFHTEYEFDFHDIRSAVLIRYLELSIESGISICGDNQFISYLISAGMERTEAYQYPDSYFTDFTEFPYRNPDDIYRAVRLLAFMFSSFEDFIAYMKRIGHAGYSIKIPKGAKICGLTVSSQHGNCLDVINGDGSHSAVLAESLQERIKDL